MNLHKELQMNEHFFFSIAGDREHRIAFVNFFPSLHLSVTASKSLGCADTLAFACSHSLAIPFAVARVLMGLSKMMLKVGRGLFLSVLCRVER